MSYMSELDIELENLLQRGSEAKNISPIGVALAGLTYSADVGAGSDIVATSTSSGKIRKGAPKPANVSTTSTQSSSVDEGSILPPTLEPTASASASSPEVSSAAVEGMRRVAEGMARRGTLHGASFSMSDKGTPEFSYQGDGASSSPTSATSAKLFGLDATTPAKNLADLAKSIQAETDPQKQMDGLLVYQEAFGQHVASVHAKTIAQAESMTGVKQLEQQLLKEVAADKLDPNYAAYGFQDSDATKQVRQQLQQAKVEARQVADQLISSNADLQGLMAGSKFFVQKVGMQVDRALKQEEVGALKAEDKAAKEEQAGFALNQATKQAASDLYPQLKGASNFDTLKFLKVNETPDVRKALELVNNGDIEGLVTHAAIGSPAATILSANAQATAVSGAKEGAAFEAEKVRAAKELKSFQDYAKPMNIELAIRAAFPTVEANKLIAEVQLGVAGLPTGKEKEKFLQESALKYARNAIEVSKKNAFFKAPTEAWSPADVAALTTGAGAPLQEAFSKATKVSPTPSFDDITAQIFLLEGDKRTSALNEFKIIATRAMNKQNQGLWGKVGSELDINKKLNDRVIKNTLGKFFGDALSGIGNTAKDIAMAPVAVASYPMALSGSIMNTSLESYGSVLSNASDRAVADAKQLTGGTSFNDWTGKQ